MESEKNPIDVKRDEFRKYLERTGALEAVSKAFTKLFECEERPENTIDFIKQNLEDDADETETVDNLKKQIAQYREEIANLTKTIEKLKLTNENSAGGSSSVTSEESTEVKQENSELPESDVKPESNENVDVKPAEPEASTSGIESTSTAATPKESEPKKPQEEN